MEYTILCPKKLVDRFKRAAKSVFPREEYAILIGRRHPDSVYEIFDLYFPPDRADYCTETNVMPQDHWFDGAEEYAQKLGHYVIGDIHSHCYEISDLGAVGAEPSGEDWVSNHEIKSYSKTHDIFAVCSINKRGKKYYSNVQFWPVIAPVRLQYV